MTESEKIKTLAMILHDAILEIKANDIDTNKNLGILINNLQKLINE